MGDRKSILFALGCLCNGIRNNSRLTAILFLCHAKLILIQESGLIFTTLGLSSTHKTLACQLHFLICNYCYW